MGMYDHVLNRRSLVGLSLAGMLASTSSYVEPRSAFARSHIPTYTGQSISRSAGTDLHAFAPAMLLDSPELQILTTYTNLSAQLASLGLAPFSGEDDPRLRAIPLLPIFEMPPLPQDMNQRLVSEDWDWVFGFSPFDIDESIEIGDPSETVTILRGRFDPEQIGIALTEQGYETTTFAGLAGYADPDPGVSIDRPVTTLWINGAQCFAALDASTVVFATSPAGIEATVTTMSGELPSLTDNDGVTSLLASVSDTTSISTTLAHGRILTQDAEQMANARSESPPIEPAGMPVAELLLLTVTPGVSAPNRETVAEYIADMGDSAGLRQVPTPDEVPKSCARLSLLFASAELAERAAPIIDGRLAQGGSVAAPGLLWTDLFTSWDITVHDDDPIVTIDLHGSERHPGTTVLNALYRHDATFIWPDDTEARGG